MIILIYNLFFYFTNDSLLKERRHVYQKKRLSDFFNRPIILEKKDNFDNILRGLSTQSQEMLDQFLTTEVIVIVKIVIWMCLLAAGQFKI